MVNLALVVAEPYALSTAQGFDGRASAEAPRWAFVGVRASRLGQLTQSGKTRGGQFFDLCNLCSCSSMCAHVNGVFRHFVSLLLAVVLLSGAGNRLLKEGPRIAVRATTSCATHLG